MKQNKTALAIVIALVTLVGCGKADVSHSAAAAPAPAGVENTTVLVGSTKGQYQKPGAPVDLTYKSDKVSVGETSNISAVFHLAAFNIDSAKVDVIVDDGLLVTGLAGDSFMLDLKSNVVDYPLSFSAYPSDAGLRYVNLIVTTTKGGESQSRAFSIPVQADGASNARAMSRPTSSVEYDANNNPILPMKAEETIKVN